MTGNASHLALVVGVTVTINAVSAVRTEREPVVAVMAGGVSYVGLALLGGLTGRYDLATALAYVFLVSALIQRGLPLIRTTTEIVTKGTK